MTERRVVTVPTPMDCDVFNFVTLSDSEGSRGNERILKCGRSADPYGLYACIALSY